MFRCVYMHTSYVPMKKLPVLSIKHCLCISGLADVCMGSLSSDGFGGFFGPKYTVFFILSKLT